MRESPAALVFSWSSDPLSREIPDIFRHGCRRVGKFRNDDGGGILLQARKLGTTGCVGWVLLRLFEGDCGNWSLTTGVVRHACRHGSDCTRGFFVWRIPDIRRGDSRDGKRPPRIVSSAPSRCVLRSGASHSSPMGSHARLAAEIPEFSFRLREMKIPE